MQRFRGQLCIVFSSLSLNRQKLTCFECGWASLKFALSRHHCFLVVMLMEYMVINRVHLTTIISLLSPDNNHFARVIRRDRRKKSFLKFKIEKAPNVLYRRGPRHFEVEQSAIKEQCIRHLRAENEHLRAEKMLRLGEDLKFSSFARNFSF